MLGLGYMKWLAFWCRGCEGKNLPKIPEHASPRLLPGDELPHDDSKGVHVDFG